LRSTVFSKKNIMATAPLATQDLLELGYLDVDIDPRIDLFEEIEKLKKEKNAIILAHYFQDPDLQDIADYVGDSLYLLQQAAQTQADVIAFAGIRSLAEAVKILTPNKKILLPDLKAGCSLADSCPASTFRKFKEKYPDHIVLSHLNCTAELKTLTDICCTSANAAHIIAQIPSDQPIIFVPDIHMGKYLQQKTKRQMVLWNGSCQVHETFSYQQIVKLRKRHPQALLIAHPMCTPQILDYADFIGAISELLHFTANSEAQTFLVAAEAGIIHQMRKQSPLKTFIPAPPNNTCACNECPHMKRNTLEKLYVCMKYELPEIVLPEWIIEQGRRCIDRMLDLSSPEKPFTDSSSL